MYMLFLGLLGGQPQLRLETANIHRNKYLKIDLLFDRDLVQTAQDAVQY